MELSGLSYILIGQAIQLNLLVILAKMQVELDVLLLDTGSHRGFLIAP